MITKENIEEARSLLPSAATYRHHTIKILVQKPVSMDLDVVTSPDINSVQEFIFEKESSTDNVTWKLIEPLLSKCDE